MRLSDLLKAVNATEVCDIMNEMDFDRFSRITSITSGGTCIFINSANYVDKIPENTRMIITTKALVSQINQRKYGICVSSNPRATFFKCFNAASILNPRARIKTTIGEGCSIGKLSSIATYNVSIGKNVIIEDFVRINENVQIGDNCVIKAGSVLGMDDYNYYEEDGNLIHINHCGRLIIEDNVDVGYCSTIGKSIYPEDTTLIGEGSKLSSKSGVGHDCKIGKRVMIYSGVILAGYVQVGDNTHITLNCTVRNGIKIGRNVTVDMGSVVIRDIPDGETVFGVPARRVIVPRKD